MILTPPIDTERRNMAITMAREQGHSYAALSRRFGLSRERIRQIVDREHSREWKREYNRRADPIHLYDDDERDPLGYRWTPHAWMFTGQGDCIRRWVRGLRLR